MALIAVRHVTFKRDLDRLRDRLNAPMVWYRDMGGYLYDARSGKAGCGVPRDTLSLASTRSQQFGASNHFPLRLGRLGGRKTRVGDRLVESLEPGSLPWAAQR